MLAFGKRVGFALLLILALVFGYQNLEALSQTARFRFNFYFRGLVFETPDLPVVIIFIASFLLGMITAGFQGFYAQLARRLDVRKRDKRIRQLEQEVAALHAQGAPVEAPEPPPPPPPTPETPMPEPEPPLPRGGPLPQGPLPPLEENPTL